MMLAGIDPNLFNLDHFARTNIEPDLNPVRCVFGRDRSDVTSPGVVRVIVEGNQ